jgi:site-specific recombinase XerD
MSELALTPPAAEMTALVARAEEFVRAAKAPATLRAYRSDWAHFEAWCQRHQFSALPAEPATVALYIADLASCRAAGTITRRLTSITKAHQAACLETPATTRHLAVSETLKGIRRSIGTAQKCKTPLLTKDLRKIIEHLPSGLIGARDRALLLVGFAGGFRRSELAKLAFTDTSFTEDGLIVVLRHSKTDQEGKGRKIGIPWGSNPDTCPVRSLREWILMAGIETGALFREISRHGRVGQSALHKDSIGLIVKRAAERAGYDPSTLAGHSLRAGLATQAAMNGATELTIMKQTGHRSLAMLRRYIRDGEMWRKNAAANLGL